jgi:CDP-diacylglycerol--glycerol-3-phosphate 3-phosphatidyltransferase
VRSLKHWLGGDTDALVLRVFPFAAHMPLSPDALSVLGVLFSAGAGVAFWLDRGLAGAGLLAVAGWCDLVDGVVARRRGRASLVGGFTDSSLDRLADMLVFGGIALGGAERGDVPLCFLSLWAATAAVLVSYTRARAEVHLHRLDQGVFGRFERFAVLLAGALTGWLVPALGLLALGTSVTALGRIRAGRRLLAELERTGVDPTAPQQDRQALQGAQRGGAERRI